MARHEHRRVTNTEWLLKSERLKVTRKGSINRRVIGKLVRGGREYTLHATKGFRSARA